MSHIVNLIYGVCECLWDINGNNQGHPLDLSIHYMKEVYRIQILWVLTMQVQGVNICTLAAHCQDFQKIFQKEMKKRNIIGN